MGNFPSNHIRIWNELSAIENDSVRLKMVDTLLNAPEYVASMKRAGVYADIISWVAAMRRGAWAHFPKYTPPAAAVATGSGSPGAKGGVSTQITKVAPAKKAMDYLHEAYDILGLSDDQALSPDVLKAAYRRKAVLHHPDKGGDPEVFDAITKAYMYLTEVYNKLVPKGARMATDKPVTMEEAVKYRNDPSVQMDGGLSDGVDLVVRDEKMPTNKPPVKYKGSSGSTGNGVKQLQEGPPVVLNPKKLDMNVFNQLFEQNRLPDPDADDGYGDWLKTQEEVAPPKKMRGKFSMSKFNELFEEAAAEQAARAGTEIVKREGPDALVFNPGAHVLGGEKSAEYTTPVGANGLAYTDLKAAYSARATFAHEVRDVKVSSKTFEQAKAERGSDPGPATAEEAMALERMKRRAEEAEQKRQLKYASQLTDYDAYAERMKSRMLISNK